MKEKHNSQELQRIDSLYDKITTLIEQARKAVYLNVNSLEVKTRYEVGRYIFEDEQNGKRASYGKQILLNLSTRLITKYGKDWSYDTLKDVVFSIFHIMIQLEQQCCPNLKQQKKHYKQTPTDIIQTSISHGLII